MITKRNAYNEADWTKMYPNIILTVSSPAHHVRFYRFMFMHKNRVDRVNGKQLRRTKTREAKSGKINAWKIKTLKTDSFGQRQESLSLTKRIATSEDEKGEKTQNLGD